MNKYQVFSIHIIYEDSYTQGEGKQVNWYDNSDIIDADSPGDAIVKYFSDKLYYSFKPDNALVNDDGMSLYYSVLVDAHSNEPSDLDIELWKKDEKVLYADNIEVFVKILLPVNLKGVFDAE